MTKIIRVCIFVLFPHAETDEGNWTNFPRIGSFGIIFYYQAGEAAG